MVGVQVFGAVTWLTAVLLASASEQWMLTGYVVAIGMAAALTFRVGQLPAYFGQTPIENQGALTRRDAVSLFASQRRWDRPQPPPTGHRRRPRVHHPAR